MKGEPLTYGAFIVQKVTPAHSFDTAIWRGDATRYQLSVVAGKIRSTQAGGAIY